MSNARGTIYIQTVGDEIRICRLISGKTAPEIRDAFVIRATKQGEDVAAFTDDTVAVALAETVRERRWTELDAICLLGGSTVACQYYEMPPLKGTALRQAVEIKLSQHIHFAAADAVIAVEKPLPTGTGETDQIHVAASAVVRSHAKAAVDAIGNAGLNLVAMSATPVAMTRLAADVTGESKGFSCFLYMDERFSTLIVLRDGRPTVATDIAFGAADLTTAIMRPIIAGDEVIQLNVAQALAIRTNTGIPAANLRIESLNVSGDRLLPLLEPVLQKLAKQLTQWLTFAGAKTGQDTTQLRLVGPCSEIPGLAETLTERLTVKTTREDWLIDRVQPTPAAEASAVAGLAAVVGASLHLKDLPSLLPPETRNVIRIERMRRTLTMACPIFAAVIAIFGTLFSHVNAQLQPRLAEQEGRMRQMQAELAASAKIDAMRAAADDLEKRLGRFGRYSPLWVGVFKEISVLLPAELQVTQFAAHWVDGEPRLTLTGDVHRSVQSPGFDKIVEQTLLLLDHSPFCSRVRLVNANRGASRKAAGLAGTLAVEITLAHAREPERKQP